MARIDIKNKIIQGKIVYYGPGLCGKTTNLEYINRRVPNTKEMMSLSTEGDRTIFFDFLPMELGEIRGISTTFKLYTVPGQVRYNLTRKMVLKNADGIVFVADAQALMLDANVESLNNLFENMRELGMDPEDIPLVLQYNKQDLPNLMSREDLDKALNKKNYPVFLSSAVKGDGVIDTLSKISNLVFKKLVESFGGAPEAKPAKKEAPSPPPPPAPAAPATAAPAPKPIAPAPQPVAPAPQPSPVATAPAADRSMEDFKRLLQDHARDLEKKLSELTEKLATKKELDNLRDTIAKFAQHKSADSATEAKLVDLGKQISKLSDQPRAQLQMGLGPKEVRELTAQIAVQVREGIPSKKEIDDLRKELSKLADQPMAQAASGLGAKELDELASKIAERTSKDQVAKQDLEQLRKELAKLADQPPAQAQAGVDKKVLEELAIKTAEQAKKGLASQQDLDQLRKEMTDLAKQTKEILSATKETAKAYERLTGLVKQSEGKLAEIQRSVTKAVSDLRFEQVSAKYKDEKPPVKEEAPPAEDEEIETDPEFKAPADQEKAAETEEAPTDQEKAAEPEEAPADLSAEAADAAKADEPEETPADLSAEAADAAKADEPEEAPADLEDFSDDPAHKNAARIARVMVADLNLYYADDIAEGIKNDDIHERMKEQFDEMHNTFASRVPEEVREKKDYIGEAIENFIEKKRKDLGGD